MKKWRKEIATKVWHAKGVVEEMPDNLIMPDDCLLALAKMRGSLNHDQLVDFLKPWYGISKHAAGILLVLQKNRPYLDTETSLFELPPRSERKSALSALRTSKKLKNMDDPIMAEKVRMAKLRDKWLIGRGKATPETKARMKKAAAAEKKMVEKQEKAKAKNQTLEIRQLALINRQAEARLGSFKDILSDPPVGDEPSQPSNAQPSNDQGSAEDSQPPPTGTPHIAARLKNEQKKKATNRLLSDRVNRGRVSAQKENARIRTPSPVAMELIRPGKRKVRIPPNAVESTPRKRMREAIE